jgi:hypothetical protein
MDSYLDNFTDDYEDDLWGYDPADWYPEYEEEFFDCE